MINLGVFPFLVINDKEFWLKPCSFLRERRKTVLSFNYSVADSRENISCDWWQRKNEQFRFPYLYSSGFLMIDITLISGANLHENIVQVLVIFKMTASYFILTSFLTFWIFIDNILIFCENKKICCALSTRGMSKYP